ELAFSFGFTAEFVELLARNPVVTPGRGTIAGRVVLDKRAVHIEDAAADSEFTWTEAQKLGHFRTALGVPLLREDTVIGVISLARSRVERFTEEQLALVTAFADQ